MKKLLQNILMFAIFAIVTVLCGIGIQKRNVAVPSQLPSASSNPAPVGHLSAHKDQRPTEAGYCNRAEAPAGMQHPYVAGPLVADIGELCVFRLSNKEIKADWVIVPPAKCYIDSSGSSLAFASNTPDKYTIIAAVVEEGIPKILTHICEYGIQPQPEPKPDPKPDPQPTPNPNFVLKDWVTRNVPENGKKQAAALASCYESAANGIESGSIRTQEAALSVVRTASQTKISNETWSEFLDTLSEKITEKLAGNNDVKTLGTVFTEIAEGLKAVVVSNAGNAAEKEVSAPATMPFTTSTKPQAAVCPDPTGKACQPQPTIQYRRWR